MITSLTELAPDARAAAERYLDTAASRLPAALREVVLDELAAHLCEHLSPGSTPGDVDILVTEAGPVTGETDEHWYNRMTAGFRLKGADERIATTWWNPADSRILLPRAVGLGWDVNYGAIAVWLGLIEPDAEAVPFTATPDPAFRAAVAFPAGMAAATVLHYLVRGRSLPELLPSHWGWNGEPDRWTPKGRAAVLDIATTVGATGVATWAAGSRRPRPRRAGALAGATLFAGIGAATTVARSLGDRRHPWLPAAMLLPGLAGVATVLLWLARAGRAEEIRRDLGATGE